MDDDERVRAGLTATLTGPGGRAAADRLCAGCVDLLTVDGAVLAIVSGGDFYSVGSSGHGVAALAGLQFTYGEGPGLEAVESCVPVLVADLAGPGTRRWPVYAHAAAGWGVRSVFALPVTVAGFPVGVLTLYRRTPGRLTGGVLIGAFLAAELAVLPLLDLIGTDMHAAVNDVGSSAWEELGAMMKSEVYQAAGVVIAQLGVPPAEAMVRLRAHAFVTGLSISDVAYQILDHRLHLGDDDHLDRPGSEHQ